MSFINRRQFVILTGSAVAAGACGCASTAGGSDESWTGPTTFDLGPVSAIKPGIDTRWEKTGAFFLVRQPSRAGGDRLFAVSAICSHKRCPLLAQKDHYLCDCHGSTFTLEGVVQIGPAVRNLNRFALTLTPAGNLTLDRSKIYPPERWAEAEIVV